MTDEPGFGPETRNTVEPNPGSDIARANGCTCPVLDNGHGNPDLAKDRGGWVIVQGCPLHWPVRAQG